MINGLMTAEVSKYLKVLTILLFLDLTLMFYIHFFTRFELDVLSVLFFFFGLVVLVLTRYKVKVDRFEEGD